MNKRRVVFWCEHSYALFSARPIIEKKLRRNNQVVIYTEKKLIDHAQKYFNDLEVEVLCFDSLKNPNSYRITKWFMILFTPISFSEFYLRRVRIKYSKLEYLVAKFSWFLKAKKQSINVKYCNLFDFLYKAKVLKFPYLEGNEFYAFTKLNAPYILVPYREKLTLIMESWDHPAKEPFLISPNLCLSWNSQLSDEIREFQSIKKVNVIWPLKFRYICSFNNVAKSDLLAGISNLNLLNDLLLFQRNKLVVYPMCTSSTYTAFDDELLFVKELAKSVEKDGFMLYIRPYPLAPKSDMEKLKLIQNAVLGFNDTSDGSDVLNKELLIHKYLLIKSSYGIINVGTTFVFDAVLANVPVIQIRVVSNQFKVFSDYTNGTHIRKYLLNQYSIEYSDQDSNCLNIKSRLNFNYSNKIKSDFFNLSITV
jgi:hypothetical protein